MSHFKFYSAHPLKGFKGLIDAIIHVKLKVNETEFNLTQMNFVCSEKDDKIFFM